MTTAIPSRLRRSARATRRAFSLVEVLIVIVIIAAITGLIAVNVFGRADDAKKNLVAIDMNTLKQGLRTFRLDYDRYPTDEEGVRVLWDKEALSPDADANKWKKYLEEPMPADRYESPWGYRQVSEHGDESTYDLWSNGPDKQEGTEDDITSWARTEAAGESGGAGPSTSTGTTGGSGGGTGGNP